MKRPSAKQRMRAAIYRRNAPIRAVDRNLPVVILRRGGTSFVPSSGYCTWQWLRLQVKLTMSSMYGKFGVPRKPMPDIYDSKVFYTDVAEVFITPAHTIETTPDGRRFHRFQIKFHPPEGKS